LEQAHTAITAAGLQNIVVAIGEPKHAARYCPPLAPSVRCLCSHDLSAYQDFGVQRGSLGQLFSLQVIAKGAEASAAGHMQGAETGDSKMIGGTFALAPGGKVLYAHYDAFAGDYPEIAKVLAAVKWSDFQIH
jgi:hypothetical protein